MRLLSDSKLDTFPKPRVTLSQYEGLSVIEEKATFNIYLLGNIGINWYQILLIHGPIEWSQVPGQVQSLMASWLQVDQHHEQVAAGVDGAAVVVPYTPGVPQWRGWRPPSGQARNHRQLPHPPLLQGGEAFGLPLVDRNLSLHSPMWTLGLLLHRHLFSQALPNGHRTITPFPG